jgi:hypothetical protein
MLLDHADVLDQYPILITEHAQNAAPLAFVGSGNHFHRIVAL